MAQTWTLSGGIADMVGGTAVEALTGFVVSSEPGIVDPETGELRVASWKIPDFGKENEWSVPGLPDTEEFGPNGFMLQLRARFWDPAQKDVVTYQSAWFELTSDLNLKDIPPGAPVVISQATYDSLIQARDSAASSAEAAQVAEEGAVAVATGELVPALGALGLPQSGSDLSATIGARVPSVVVAPTGSGGDQVSINAAASTAAIVDLTEGTFYWDADVAPWTTGFTLRGQGKDRTTIQLGPGVLYGPRWSGATVPVGYDNVIKTTAAGSRTIETWSDLTAALAPGDWFSVSNALPFGARSYYSQAEFCQVEAITATTITVRAPLRFRYDSGASLGSPLRLARHDLLAGVACENLTVLAHPTATVRQTLVMVSDAQGARVTGVRAQGRLATEGVDLWKCIEPVVDVEANDILDLNNPTLNAWEGYGVRTLACLDAEVRVMGEGCRHLFDDSSAQRLPPSLRTRVTGTARNCVSAGFSTHGGSDECLFHETTAANCGGGYVLRGRAGKGRAVTVAGINAPASDVYSALGGATQSYLHGLWVGETQEVGGARCPAGTGLDWEWLECDVVGTAGNTAVFANRIELTDLVNARIALGVTRVYGHRVIGIKDSITDSLVGYGTVINTGTSQVVQATSQGSSPAARKIDGLVIEDLTVQGYAASVIEIGGGATSGDACRGIRLRRNRIRGKAAGYAASARLFNLTAGYFATTDGAIEIRDNTHQETAAATALDGAGSNGGAGLGTAVTKKGNLGSAGYDTAP